MKPTLLRAAGILAIVLALAAPWLADRAAALGISGPGAGTRNGGNDTLCVADNLPARLEEARAQGLSYVPGIVVVTLRHGAAPLPMAQVAAQAGADYLCGYTGLRSHIFTVPSGAEQATVDRLKTLPWVETAQLSRIRKVQALPNDTFYTGKQWAPAKVGLPAAWDITTGSSSVVIAIVDTGIDLTHPDLQSKLVAGRNMVSPESPASDGFGHGTHVAGIAAAASNNNTGIAGACWGCRLMPIKVLGDDGTGDDTATAAGITWAVDNGAKIINMSLGGPDPEGPPAVLQQAINYAHGKGAVLFAGSGNCRVERVGCEGPANPVYFPAAMDKVISVAATNNKDQQASYSQFHATVKLSAPGGDDPAAGESEEAAMIYSTHARNVTAAGYHSDVGTSQATPLVAGVAGLMWSLNPNLTNVQIEEMLTRTAVDLGTAGRDERFGFGRIDGLAAVKAAQATVATPTPSPTPTPPAGGGPAPILTGPADNAALTGLGASLTWQNPSGTVQFQVQVIPANNDGPAINLIIGAPDQVAAAKFDVLPPVFGQGPYIMLPGMSYTWRVRTTRLDTPMSESSPGWGAWSPDRKFRTPPPTAATLGVAAPADGATVAAATGPLSLQWTDSNKANFYYEIQVSGDTRFDANPVSATSFVFWNLVHGGITTPAQSWAMPAGSLQTKTTYFWRVRPRVQGDGTEVAWGPIWKFMTP